MEISTHIAHVKGPFNKNDALSKNQSFIVNDPELQTGSDLWIVYF